ncbi:MAG: TolC family protein [Prevotellaceae bacterium]|jgi:outer membrane protein TolC|nr:TolC family protein [Prevotellaceae bacterium]
MKQRINKFSYGNRRKGGSGKEPGINYGKRSLILKLCYAIIVVLLATELYAQKAHLRLTIDEVIDLARKQSPDVVMAKHNFHSSYWSYCYFKANYLPSLNFSSTPNFYHQINVITMPDGTSQFVQQNQLITNGALSLSQNIALTGGTLSLTSDIRRLDLFGLNNGYSYQTNPVSITYSQTLFGYNSLKWAKRTEPLRYEIAKKNYVTTLELVAYNAVARFFALANAQSNLDIARTNYANADTLYTFAEGRYKIGRITESEMLQWEVKKLNEETNLLNAQLNLEDYVQELRAYLGITDSIVIEAVLSHSVPQLKIDAEKALEQAFLNNPTVVGWERSRIESEGSVANAKANAGLQADLYVQFGLSKAGTELSNAYKDPLNQQQVQVGLRFPILDWGRRKGQVRVAESNRNLVETQIEQDKMNFTMNLIKTVRQFNLQMNQIVVAEKTDYTAHRRNEVAQKLYVLGRVTILDLNDAILEKDNAKRGYINALSNFWMLYYNIRRLTLYDFEKDIQLTEDYNLLLK